jgi:hypothetical protein
MRITWQALYKEGHERQPSRFSFVLNSPRHLMGADFLFT